MSTLLQTLYFGKLTALIDRIYYNQSIGKKIVFIVGSPLTTFYDNAVEGVLGVDEIVDLVKREFANNKHATRELDEALKISGHRSYQSAFQFLDSYRGQDRINQLIQTAVLNAYKKEASTVSFSDRELEDFEKDINNWILAPGVMALGQLLATEFKNSVVLTTNFDPLIQIATRRAGGQAYFSALHREGNLAQTQADGAHIVHLHGYWRGKDTLHTPRQLLQPRPQLRSSLASLLKDAFVVVVAYGAWDDLITATISELLADDNIFPELAWTFYSESSEDIIAQNAPLFERILPGIDRGRVSLYSGIDCHDFFPALIPENSEISSCADVIEVFEEGDEFDGLFESPVTDSPINALPVNPDWVGREDELKLLESSSHKVIVLTGIGGQGKSSLASMFLDRLKKKDNSSYVLDWRDCREQGNTLHMAICGAIEKASTGRLTLQDISQSSTDDIVRILISELAGRHGAIVFDNVDHYVDLEANRPIGVLNTLVERALQANLGVKFIFTARPLIKAEDPNFLEIHLDGLSKNDARKLFMLRYGRDVEDEVFDKLYAFTAGHPLWLGLIAAQCLGNSKSVETVIEGSRSHQGVELPRHMLRSTWELLNGTQKNVLRTIAELERPEDLDALEEITSLTFNKLNKAITKLRSMSLLEMKITDGGSELIDLHPLVKQFVREEFPKKDRETFIGNVIKYLDRQLLPFKVKSNEFHSSKVTELWIHKIDLLANGGGYELAIDNLSEVVGQLERAGMVEQIVRLGKKIFAHVSWLGAPENVKGFNQVFAEFTKSIVELEGVEEADRWLLKYEANIPGKGAQYINFCNLQAYKYWYIEKYEDAIEWATKGVLLKTRSNVDTTFDCQHTLALAQRDSGLIKDAFKYFSEGLTEDQIFKDYMSNKKEGEYYGNLGRCYHLEGTYEKALAAYHISANRLEESNTTKLNQGYIRYWVALIMEQRGRREDSLMFHRAALDKWEKVAPSKAADGPQLEIDKLIEMYPELKHLSAIPIWRCENRYSQWMGENMPALSD